MFLCLATPLLSTLVLLAIIPGALEMAKTFGAMGTQVALTAPAVAMILGAALTGYLSERWGRRAVIVVGLLVYAGAGIFGFIASNLALLIASRVTVGLAGGVLLTSIYAVIGEYFAGSARERILGFTSMAGSGSAVAILALMVPVVENFGWHAPFLFYATSLVLIPFALKGLHRGKTATTGTMLSWRPVLACWPIYLLLTAYTVGMFMMAVQGPFPLGAKDVTSPSMIGRLMVAGSLAGALGGALFGFLRRGLGFRQMFIVISLALGIGLLLVAWAPTPGPFVMATLVLGLGAGFIEPTIASELLKRTPEPLHDRAMGVNVAALFLGQFLNPFVIAPFRDARGIEFAVHVVGIAYLFAAALFLIAVLHAWHGRLRPI